MPGMSVIRLKYILTLSLHKEALRSKYDRFRPKARFGSSSLIFLKMFYNGCKSGLRTIRYRLEW